MRDGHNKHENERQFERNKRRDWTGREGTGEGAVSKLRRAASMKITV